VLLYLRRAQLAAYSMQTEEALLLEVLQGFIHLLLLTLLIGRLHSLLHKVILLYSMVQVFRGSQDIYLRKLRSATPMAKMIILAFLRVQLPLTLATQEKIPLLRVSLRQNWIFMLGFLLMKI